MKIGRCVLVELKAHVFANPGSFRRGPSTVDESQQPPRKALLNIVQPITRGCLCNLNSPNCGIAAQHQSKEWSGFQSVLQSSDLYPEPISRDLYHRLKRASAQANSRQCSCKPSFPTMPASAVFPSFITTTREIKPRFGKYAISTFRPPREGLDGLAS